MIQIRALDAVDMAGFGGVITGYVSAEKYIVAWGDAPEGGAFTYRLTALSTPVVKRFELEDRDYYEAIIAAGLSHAAYDGDALVGVALADKQAWNNTFWLHDLHVSEAQRGRGIGRRLMDAVTDAARSAGCRTIIAETQNTNVPAIRFYRAMGFRVEAIDVSLYSNADYPDGEIALFMKRAL